MLNACLLAVRVADPDLREPVERRLAALESFYSPLGEVTTAVRWVEDLRLIVGAIRFDGERAEIGACLAWGGSLPPSLSAGESLLKATDRQLRGLDFGIAAIAAAERSATLVTGAAGPTTLYAASSGEAEAWSTHAVAAGWLATGVARLDAEALPELVSAQLVGGERTLLQGVRALPAATRVSVEPGGTHESTYWPPRERWAPLAEERAQAHAETAMLEHLDRRLRPAGMLHCGLTAGLDSRVAAVALCELGLPVAGFTWCGTEWDETDAEAGPRVGATLGIDHETTGYDWWDDAETMTRIAANVRWSEGALPMGFGEPRRPAAGRVFVTGEGGETGRAYYYQQAVLTYPRPTERQLSRTVAGTLVGALRDARREVRAAMSRRVADWVAQAAASGHGGWRRLDVLYEEQVLRRWSRAMLPRGPIEIAPAMGAPQISRGLTALPLGERLGAGFHRRFLESRRPELAAPPTGSPPQRPGVPPLARRVAARGRTLRDRRDRRPTSVAGELASRPAFTSWIAEEVLGGPRWSEAMGERWAARARTAFLAGEAWSIELGLWAAGPSALDAALTDLRRAASVPRETIR